MLLLALNALIVFNGTTAYSQQVTVNASTAISVPTGVFFGTVGSVTIQSSGAVKNDGTIGVQGDFTNNGGALNSGTGKISFLGGTAIQSLKTSASTLYDLTVSKTSGKVTLSDDAAISHQLTMTSGDIETGTHNLVFTPSALCFVECNSSRVIGNAVMQDRSVGIGALSFLDFDMAAGVDNIGNVSITRVSGPAGICSNGTNSGIACYWLITPTTQPVSGRNVTFHWLTDLDNSKDFSTYEAEVWRYSGSQWLYVPNSAYATSSFSLWTSPTIVTTSLTKWTISTGGSPLPVELLSFDARCANNKVKLNWVTASETNNDYFTIERSKDNNIFEKVLDYPGAGNSNHLISYSAIDDSPYAGNSYYRLKQTDFDGIFTYSGIVPVSCGQEQDFDLISVIQGTHDHEIEMTFVAVGGEQYTYGVYDITGKLMMESAGVAASGINEVHIEMGFIAESLYMVTLQTSEKSFSRKVVLK